MGFIQNPVENRRVLLLNDGDHVSVDIFFEMNQKTHQIKIPLQELESKLKQAFVKDFKLPVVRSIGQAKVLSRPSSRKGLLL